MMIISNNLNKLISDENINEILARIFHACKTIINIYLRKHIKFERVLSSSFTNNIMR